MHKKTVDFPFVEVRWMDAHSTDEWTKYAGLPELAPITTRGWLIKDEKDYIVIAGTVAHEDRGEETLYGEVLAIPRGWAKIKRLKV